MVNSATVELILQPGEATESRFQKPHLKGICTFSDAHAVQLFVLTHAQSDL